MIEFEDEVEVGVEVIGVEVFEVEVIEFELEVELEVNSGL